VTVRPALLNVNMVPRDSQDTGLSVLTPMKITVFPFNRTGGQFMKKVLFLSVLAATILMGGLLTYALWKTPGSSQDFFSSGKHYYEQKKYSEAEIQFFNAIEKDARNRDARYFLALSYFNQLNFSAAAQQLRALLEYLPEDTAANLLLGNVYLTGGRADLSLFHQAAEIAQKILAKEPQNIGALILSGNASAELQDYGSSVEVFEKALSLDPQNAALFISLGTSETLQKNYPEAEQAFLKARQANPKDKNALVSLANYYRAVHESAKAEAVLRDALALYPSDRQIYIQAAAFYYQTGRFEEVEKVLRDVQARSARDPEPSLLLCDFYGAQNRSSDARNLLLDLKKRFPQSLEVAAKLAVNLIEDQPDRARPEIDQIVKAEPKNPVGQILLGELQFASSQYTEAEATFGKDFLINGPFPEPHFFLGRIAAAKGQVDQAQDQYQKSLAANGRYLPARLAMAEIFLNRGRLAESREEIRKLLDTQPNFIPGRLFKAALDTTEKKYPEAERELNSLVKEQPDNVLIHRQMALYYDSRGRTADAEKSLVHALELQPESLEILQQLARFYIKQKQTDRAIQRINTIPDGKKQAVHYDLMGIVYSQGGRTQDAEKAFKMALQKDQNRKSSHIYLVDQYIKTGRLDEGLKQLDELIRMNPSNAGAYATKGLLYESQSKIENAKQNYEQALKVNPDLDFAANNLAYILVEEGRDLNAALGWAQIARKRSPENENAADTLGWVYYKLGNHVLARDQLQFALSKQPDNPVFQYHLAMIYKETKQINEAQSALKKAVGSPKDFKEKSLAQAALKDIANLR
jgi:tetratricopeptide (TPR) repeat protein